MWEEDLDEMRRDAMDESDELYCTCCEKWVRIKTKNVNEFTDADGNRGMWVTYTECSVCGSDELLDYTPSEDDGDEE